MQRPRPCELQESVRLKPPYLYCVLTGSTDSGCIGFETLCSHFLNSHPEMLSQLVVQQTESANEYFGHVVRYYGQLQCLDDAMQAVIAQVQTNLCPQSGPSDRDILVKYGKALRSLQEAINGSLWDGPEVLCATQLLALFEVSSHPPLWNRTGSLIACAGSPLQRSGKMERPHTRRCETHATERAREA